MRLSYLVFTVAPALAIAAAPLPASAQAAGVTLTRSEILNRARIDTAAGELRVARRGRVDTVAGSADRVTLRPGDVLVVPTERSATHDSSAGTAAHVDLPDRYLMLDRAGAIVVTLSVRVEVQGGGLRYDPAGGVFRGTILIGLEDSVRRTERVALEPVQLEITADVDDVAPARVTIAHTNIPFVEVRVRALDPGDTVSLRIRPVFAPEGHEAPVPVLRPALAIAASPRRIQGFGLQTTVLTLTPPPVLARESVTVTLSADPGVLDTTFLTIAAGGVGVTRLRSAGTGVALVQARAGTVASGEARVSFVFPWAFLVATVLGGAVGAVLRARRHRDEPKRLRLGAIDLIVGALLGVIVAAAYAVGINLLGVDLPALAGEAAVLVLAALGSYRGAPNVLRQRLGAAAAALLLGATLTGASACVALGRGAADGLHQSRAKLAETAKPVARAAVEEAGRAFEDSIRPRVAALTAALRDSLRGASDGLLDSVEARVARMRDSVAAALRRELATARDSVGGAVELWAARAGGAADRSLRLALAASIDSLAAGLEPEGDVGGALVRLGDRVVRQAVTAISDQSRRNTPWWVWAGIGLVAASALAGVGTFLLRLHRRGRALQAMGQAIQERADPALASRVQQLAATRGVEPWLHRYLENQRLLVSTNAGGRAT